MALLLSFPLLLWLGYSLPLGMRESLVFNYTDPTLLAAVTSAFVHFEFGHLITNVGLYVLLIPVLYVLCVLSGRQQQFRVFAFTTFVAFPPVLSYLNLAIARSSVTFGASGVIMVFAGYLPLAVSEYLDTNFDIGPVSVFAPTLFFASLGFIAVLSLQSVLLQNPTVLLGTAGLVLAAVLSTVLYGLSVYDQTDNAWTKIKSAMRATGYTDLLLLTVLLLFVVPIIAFPASPQVDSGVLNLYEHFLGYALGFMTPYIARTQFPGLY
ncbi:hypothetical protein D3D01_21725 [Haloarcula sp. Atlit-7R]|nr:hypothetical protein D3D01_21725 [Haloarcula sp. Atlit-7R]